MHIVTKNKTMKLFNMKQQIHYHNKSGNFHSNLAYTYFPNVFFVILHTSLALMLFTADANLTAAKLKLISSSYHYMCKSLIQILYTLSEIG